MKTSDINIRDPFVLLEDGVYYLYGTRGKTCWGKATGFDCYRSLDLENWEGPFEIFRKTPDFWSDRHYWAPECHKIDGSYYLFATFKSEDRCRGTQILKADNPMGPFRIHSDGPVTPPDWECLDGTYYRDENGRSYMVFCHEWLQVKVGTICAIPLKDDLSAADGDPIYLFSATDAPWSAVISQDTHPDDCYVTDGPFVFHAPSGALMMLWSSFDSNKAYTQGLARSLSGKIEGPWVQEKEVLYSSDGGHGMLFRDKEDRLRLVLHTPNSTPNERPCFPDVEDRLKTL